MVTTGGVKQAVFFGMLIFLSLSGGSVRPAAEMPRLPLYVGNFLEVLHVRGTLPKTEKKRDNEKVSIISFVADDGRREAYMYSANLDTVDEDGPDYDRAAEGVRLAETDGRHVNWKKRESHGVREIKWCAVQVSEAFTIFVPYEYRKAFATDVCEANAENLGKASRPGLFGVGARKAPQTLKNKIHSRESVDPGSGSGRVRGAWAAGLEGLSDMQLFFGVCSLICDVVFDATFIPYWDNLRPEFILNSALSGALCPYLFSREVCAKKLGMSSMQMGSLTLLFDFQCAQMAKLALYWGEPKVLIYLKNEQGCPLAGDFRERYRQRARSDATDYGSTGSDSAEGAISADDLLAASVAREQGGCDLMPYVDRLFKAVDRKWGRQAKCRDYKLALEPLRKDIEHSPGALKWLLSFAEKAAKEDIKGGYKLNKRACAMFLFLGNLDRFADEVNESLLALQKHCPPGASSQIDGLVEDIAPSAARAREIKEVISEKIRRENAEQFEAAATRAARLEHERAASLRQQKLQTMAAVSRGARGDALGVPLLADYSGAVSDDHSSVSGSPHSGPRTIAPEGAEALIKEPVLLPPTIGEAAAIEDDGMSVI